MTGRHLLRVKTPLCTYKVMLQRNITVLTGDSGIGKTSIYRAIYKYLKTSGKCDISVVSDCNVRALNGVREDSIELLKTINNSIVVIDEGSAWIKSNEFASIVNSSTNYFLIISRDPLFNLSHNGLSMITLKTHKVNGIFETVSEDTVVSIPEKLRNKIC